MTELPGRPLVWGRAEPAARFQRRPPKGSVAGGLNTDFEILVY